MAFLKACSLRLLLATFVLVLMQAKPCLAQDTKVDFAKDIKPILESQCFSCHHTDNDEGGFILDDLDELFDRWIYKNEADDSPLIDEYVASTDKDFMMPPPEDSSNWSEGEPSGPLDTSDIDLIKRWINEGAEWPEEVKLVLLTDEVVNSNEENADEVESKIPRPRKANVWTALGSLHPAAIHLPIGLLMAAGLFALLGLRGNFVMSDCAYYCLWLGTIGAIIACVSGMLFTDAEGVGTVNDFQDLMNQEHEVFWHRTGGLAVTIFAFLLALFAAGARNRDPDDGFLWKLGLIILAGGIGWVGHEGGKLTYGDSHYKDLIGSVEALTGWDVNQDGVVDEWDTPEEEAADADAADSDVEENAKDTGLVKESEIEKTPMQL